MTAAPLRVGLHLPPLKLILLPSTLRESKQDNILDVYSCHPRGIGPFQIIMAAKHSADSCVILEAGVFSLLIRARVGTDTSDQVNDINSIARSYILLHPIARAEQAVKQTLANKNAARVLILPKKALPSKGERFMAFVAKANASDDDVKDELTTSADYETKTAGIHHTPAATKVCEGTYTLSSAGGRTHLVYVITQPETLGKFPREHLKVQVRGSFLISTRNPTYEGPANVQLPVGPEFSEQ